MNTYIITAMINNYSVGKYYNHGLIILWVAECSLETALEKLKEIKDINKNDKWEYILSVKIS